ncbi:MAG TPA: helix-turn-helix transcriptional regulator [Rhizomicrobium sp.]|jgi:HTH-type transcriptional regulator/antitoxin HipB
MRVRTPADLAAAIRERRRELGLDQATFAARIGVNRKWVIGIERGRARAEIGLVLRALDALDIPLVAGTPRKARKAAPIPPVDIDSIVSAARKK